MYLLMSLALVLLNEAGSQQGGAGGEEGAPGNEGFGFSADLPDLAYPAIAAGVFLALLLVVFAFRSTSKRH